MGDEPELPVVGLRVDVKAELLEALVDFVANGLLVDPGHPGELRHVPGAQFLDGLYYPRFDVARLPLRALNHMGPGQYGHLPPLVAN